MSAVPGWLRLALVLGVTFSTGFVLEVTVSHWFALLAILPPLVVIVGGLAVIFRHEPRS